MSGISAPAIRPRFVRLHSSIDVLYRCGALVNINRLQEADRLAKERAKLAHQVAFEMKKGKA